MNKLFFIASMRTRRQISVSFEIEIIEFSFDYKQMGIRIVNKDDINKAVAAGLQPNENGYVTINIKHDFLSDDIIYNIVGEI